MDEVQGGRHLIDESHQKTIRAKLDAAQELIERADTNLSALISRLIGTVAVYRIAGRDGGSVSCCIGLIWLSPGVDWTVEYYAEMLVHEFAHNSVFLEDVVRGVMPNPRLLEHPCALTISAIRKTRRPYDKALHSACVAIAISYFYNAIGNKETAARFLQPARQTISELIDNNINMKRNGMFVLTQNGEALLQELDSFVRHPSYKAVAASLSDADVAKDLIS